MCDLASHVALQSSGITDARDRLVAEAVARSEEA
jgi:hypothetical protein